MATQKIETRKAPQVGERVELLVEGTLRTGTVESVNAGSFTTLVDGERFGRYVGDTDWRSVHEAALSWFTGKARSNAQDALLLLDRSVAQGYWVPGASRRLRGALNKSNVAIKYARHYERTISKLDDRSTLGYSLGPAWRAVHEMSYGSFENAQGTDFAALRAAVAAPHNAVDNNDAGRELQLEVLAEMERYVKSFSTIAAEMAKLDATRPIPTFTSLGLSPTVTRTLTDLGLDGQPATVRVCPIRWDLVTHTAPDGKVTYGYVGTLLWPEGTVHGASKYNWTCNNAQCQACGHAIKNPFNWVPMLVDSASGVPHSLWVGRDCCEKLFGFKVTGDVELVGRVAA